MFLENCQLSNTLQSFETHPFGITRQSSIVSIDYNAFIFFWLILINFCQWSPNCCDRCKQFIVRLSLCTSIIEVAVMLTNVLFVCYRCAVILILLAVFSELFSVSIKGTWRNIELRLEINWLELCHATVIAVINAIVLGYPDTCMFAQKRKIYIALRLNPDQCKVSMHCGILYSCW
jgi:hypothetical protein